jgi:hypothetical protein
MNDHSFLENTMDAARAVHWSYLYKDNWLLTDLASFLDGQVPEESSPIPLTPY